jgi:hypothetical protein
MSYEARESMPAIALERLMPLLIRVRSLFSNAGLSTEIKIGEEYADQEGNADRVVFIPHRDIGITTEQPIRMGAFGSCRNDAGCTALVWGVSEDGDTRFDSAEQILHNVQVALQEVGGDRVSFVALSRDEEPRDVHYGEHYRFSFRYLYQVHRNTPLQPLPQPAAAAPTVDPKSAEEQ